MSTEKRCTGDPATCEKHYCAFCCPCGVCKMGDREWRARAISQPGGPS